MNRTNDLDLTTIAHAGDYRIEGMMLQYNSFVPRLYNFCKSIGMEFGKIMPSRAFCSDESQGLPIILIAKHFGAFPFNHGRLGGVVSTDRHGAYAAHGRDLVIVHASHVGYDTETNRYGLYRRLQREDQKETFSCARIMGVVEKYLELYKLAQDNVFIEFSDDNCVLTVDNQLLDPHRRFGLFLDFEFMLARHENTWYRQVRSFSTAKSFVASPAFAKRMRDSGLCRPGRTKLSTALTPDLFRFKNQMEGGLDNQLERNLLGTMPYIVASDHPLLIAAQASVQVEFDRASRSIKQEPEYHGKTLLYISGMNIDFSPYPGQVFPTTLFVPWAAYAQPRQGAPYTLEQAELVDRLLEQSDSNPEQIDIDRATDTMAEEKRRQIERGGLKIR